MTEGQTLALTSRLSATSVQRATLETVLERFGIDGPATVERTAHGLLNRVWRVDAADGRRWVLKQYLDDAGHASSGAISAQHATIAALSACGLPTVPPVAAEGGRTLVLQRGRRYALFPFVEGAPPGALSLRAAGELGTLLGRIHAELRRLQPPVLDPGPHQGGWPTADPEQTRLTITSLLVSARARAPRDPFDALAEQRLRERLVLLDRHAARRPGPRSAPPAGWVHGDFHPLNLLYREGRPVAVLDWDRLGVKPVTEEAVRAATQFFVADGGAGTGGSGPRSSAAGGSGSLDLARVRAYARAYREASGHTPEQLAAGVHRVWWERLNDFWMLRWRYARRDERASELFPAAAAQIAWWCEEYQQVLDAYTN